MLIHKACKSQLVRIEGEPVYCDVCSRDVREEEIEEADDSPSPFSG